MTVSQDLQIILDKCNEKQIAKKTELQKLLSEVNFNARLIEELTENDLVNDILEEFICQSLIWVDDEALKGEITYLKKIIATLDDNEELLKLWSNLSEILKSDQHRPSLCKGVITDLVNEFNILGWSVGRVFLESLGLAQGDLHELEQVSRSDRFHRGLQVFLQNLPHEISTDRELTQFVIDKLNQNACRRPAQRLAEKYL